MLYGLVVSIVLLIALSIHIATRLEAIDSGIHASLAAFTTANRSHIPTDNPAFLSFLAPDYHDSKEDSTAIDWYYTSLRILGYQLMHAPGTKSRYPFLVAVTGRVNPAKRAQLAADGAVIVELPPIHVLGQSARKEFRDQMEKLSFFSLYDTHGRFCYIDADNLLLDNLDGIFEDPAAQLQPTLSYKEEIKVDEPPLPTKYLMAGHSEGTGHHADKRTQNARSGDYVNAGFILFAPGPEIYDYYMWVANHTDRWETVWAEQNLYNYAHRRPGNMPWTRINDNWNTFRPADIDMVRGTRSVHGHLWEDRYAGMRQQTWIGLRDEMTWFYGNRSQRLGVN